MFSHNTGWHSWLTRSRFGKPCSPRDLVHWQPRCGFHPTTEVEERYKGCSLIDPILIPLRFSQSVNVGVLNHAGLLSQLLDVGQLGISGPRIRPAGAGGARRATPTPPGRPPPVCGSPSLGASSPTLRARRRRKPPRACRRDPGPLPLILCRSGSPELFWIASSKVILACGPSSSSVATWFSNQGSLCVRRQSMSRASIPARREKRRPARSPIFVQATSCRRDFLPGRAFRKGEQTAW